MADLVSKEVIGGPFTNACEYVQVSWDVAVESGATGDYEVLQADSACIVEFKYLITETTMDSTGDAAVISLGKGTAGAEFLDTEGQGSFIAEGIGEDNSGRFVELTNGESINLTIGGNTVTAGKFHMVFAIYRKPF